jgi:hypothetical protein
MHACALTPSWAALGGPRTVGGQLLQNQRPGEVVKGVVRQTERPAAQPARQAARQRNRSRAPQRVPPQLERVQRQARCSRRPQQRRAAGVVYATPLQAQLLHGKGGGGGGRVLQLTLIH